MTRTTLRLALPSVALALLVLTPFRDKAFTIDDTLFMLEAEHALVDPVHPAAFETTWNAVDPERASKFAASGPVMPWLLVPSVLAGGAEWLAHLVQAAFLALALVATVALATRLGFDPVSAMTSGVLLAATPVALAMAGTAMPDVPAMALGVAGMERLVAWREQRRVQQAIVAAVLLGLAPLARSHLLLLIGVGALLLAGTFLDGTGWRRREWRTWLPLGAALLLTGALAFLTRDVATRDVGFLTATRQLSSTRHLVSNLLAFASHWVLAVPFAIPWILLRPSVRRGWKLYAAVLIAWVLLAMWCWHSLGKFIFVGPVAVLGVAALWDVLADGWKRRDGPQLTLGLWLLVALPTAFYVHLPSKYLLASAPAAAILVAREFAARRTGTVRLVVGATVFAGLTLGVAILRADATFADLGRRAAAELIAPHVAAGRRVWYAGHWGFQWYAERAGGRALTMSRARAAEGDLVVASLQTEPGHILELYPHRTRLESIADGTPGGRVMDKKVGAGFYSNAWGFLPWAWGDDVLDRFDLWRIQRAPGDVTPSRSASPDPEAARSP